MTRWHCLVPLVFLGCSGSAVVAGNQQKSAAHPPTNADYSLTQKSSSLPERASRSNEVVAEAPLALNSENQGCDAESCDGTLASAAVAELRATAAKAQDCYERELKDNAKLEGKVTVMLRLPGPTASRSPCPAKLESGGFAASEAFKQCLVSVFANATAQAEQGCVDVAVPLSFVRKEVEPPAAATSTAAPPAPAAGGKKAK